MIRTVSPCRKSSGTAKASQLATPSSTSASVHTTGVSGRVKRRKRSGLARNIWRSLVAYRASRYLRPGQRHVLERRASEKGPMMTDDVTKDSNGNVLADGDSVTLIKDLKVK